MSVVEFKVGTSFNVPVAYTPVASLAPANLANTTITSQLRKADGTRICAFAVTKANDNMSFNLSVPNTDTWPFGIVADWDIKMVDTIFGTFYSDKTELRLVQPVTR